MHQSTDSQSARFALCALLLLIAASPAVFATAAEPFKANYDESLVPEYTLPDPLSLLDGRQVESADVWISQRRPEILQLFEEQVYGRAPAGAPDFSFREVSRSNDALNGKAIRREVAITLASQPEPVVMTLLLYAPRSGGPVPCFLGLNFYGNHTISDEPEIQLNPNWMRANKEYGIVDHRATEASRGVQADRWPVELILDRGYAVATIYCGDIDPDVHDGFQNGVHPAFYAPGQSQPKPDEWGTIAAWAWGLSRGLDYLERDELVDGTKVAVIGHSRLGKTALWAGAVDPRFAMAISNNSGCGGAALSRRRFGETVRRINGNFPHWFCGNFHAYNDREEELPVDQHMLIALIAPRPVYVASAEDDLWADPQGEFLAAAHADPVYRLLGTDGLGGDAPPQSRPPVDEPLKSGRIGYHLRTGKHNITEYDWRQYLDFADHHLRQSR